MFQAHLHDCTTVHFDPMFKHEKLDFKRNGNQLANVHETFPKPGANKSLGRCKRNNGASDAITHVLGAPMQTDPVIAWHIEL